MFENKKAQEGGATGSTMISVIIAVAVIFLVFAGLLAIYFYANSNVSLFPSFGNSTAKVTGVEIIRYDSYLDKIQYYNANHVWTDFSGSGEATLDEKTVNYNDLHTTFKNYFYSTAHILMDKHITMDTNSYVILDDSNLGTPYNMNPADIDAALFVSNPDGSPYIGYYLLTMNNNLQFFPTVAKTGFSKFLSYFELAVGVSAQKATNSDLRGAVWSSSSLVNNEASLKAQIIKIRDSSLQKTIDIPYKIDQTGQSQTITVCVQRISDIYLTVDLQREVSSDASCS